MIRAGDGFFSVVVTTLFVSLLLVAGGTGVALAVPLVACAVYRARCSIGRLAAYESGRLGATVTHV